MPPKKQPLVPKVIIQTNDEGISSDSSSGDEFDEPSAESTKIQHNQTTRRPKRKWKDAGLIFPPNIIHKKLVSGKYSKKVAREASVVLAGVLEYLVAEVLDMAKECADSHQKRRIQPRHLMLAVRRDEEFNELLKNVTFASTGVVPQIQEILLKKKSPSPMLGKRKSEQRPASGIAKKKTRKLLSVPNLSESDDSN